MTTISNQGTITYSYTGAKDTQSSSSNVANINLADEYSIEVVKHALHSTYTPGENVTYQIAITNAGTGNLYGITLTDDLGGSSELVYMTETATLIFDGEQSAITPTTTDPLVFTLPSMMRSGETAFITYVATVRDNIGDISSITNTATATAHSGSPTGTTVTNTSTETITEALYASVNIEKSVSDADIIIGQTYSYIFDLTNSGNLDATNVVLTDNLPEDFVVSSITSTTGSTTTTWDSADYTIDPSTNTLTLPNSSSTNTITVPASTSSGD